MTLSQKLSAQTLNMELEEMTAALKLFVPAVELSSEIKQKIETLASAQLETLAKTADLSQENHQKFQVLSQDISRFFKKLESNKEDIEDLKKQMRHISAPDVSGLYKTVYADDSNRPTEKPGL